MDRIRFYRLVQAAVLASTALALPHLTHADNDNATPQPLSLTIPSGQQITPLAPMGAVQQALNPGLPDYPNFVAGMAVRSQLSPDGTTLAILCAGQNTLYKPDGKLDEANSTQYIFLYNVAGANQANPKLTQVIKQTNAHVGLVWAPDGNTLYATGGNDDAVYVYTKSGSTLTLAGSIPLGHPRDKDNKGIGVGLLVQPNASGLGISADGKTLVVANNYSDSISVIDTALRKVRYEHDLRPYFSNNEGTSGAAGGTFPFAVALKGNSTAYVSSSRDREVVVVDISSATAGRLVKRIKLDGNALGMTFNKAQTRLFVAQDNADQIAVINMRTNAVNAKIDARGPASVLSGSKLTGAATFAVTLSPDEQTLYAVNSGSNSIAVIEVRGAIREDRIRERDSKDRDRPLRYKVAGLIPTAYDPHDVTFSADGKWMYIINGKSITGPNPDHLFDATARLTSFVYPGGNDAAAARAVGSNQYQFQLERASLVSAPVPQGRRALRELTKQVALNNSYTEEFREQDQRVMDFLREKIQHVIYVVKENRTFDQVLGDLKNGAKADPKLAVFGEALTPNFHRLSTQFVTLDNFYDPGDGSMDGWSWAMAGRVTNTETITQQISYAGVDRGLSYESEGTNRNVPVGLKTTGERDAAVGGGFYTSLSAGLPGGTDNLLVGTADHAVTDAPFGIQNGFIFDAALKAGKTVRNYGFLVNNIGSIGTKEKPVSDPFAAGIVQVATLNPSLIPLTDLYFRGYDQAYPDLWRFNEWKREFAQFVANKNLPNLSLVRLSHDHMGSFEEALAGVNTPETQQADDDLAVGRLIETVAKSPYAKNTLIIITEDDCQDGPDHVDSHRATAYVVGPYVKKGAIVSTHYSHVNALRTIEDILGAEHINLNTASLRPMSDVFDINTSGDWNYTAVASSVLATTSLLAGADAEVKYAAGPKVKPKHDAAYWAKMTRGFNFAEADRVPTGAFNKILWAGLAGGKPYPAIINGGQKSSKKDLDE
jgi:DNA-binding beta-propeller fold protein YncE